MQRRTLVFHSILRARTDRPTGPNVPSKADKEYKAAACGGMDVGVADHHAVGMHDDDGPYDSAPSTDRQSGPTHIWATLSHHRLRELLTEVQDRVEDIVAETRDRMDALLDAVVAVSSGLELDNTLRQIVQAAINLADARYGALGVIAPDGSLSQFVNVGIEDATRD